MADKLMVVEKDDAYLVVWVDDQEDWVAIFLKTRDFLARQWAERMVYLNNHRNNTNAEILTTVT